MAIASMQPDSEKTYIEVVPDDGTVFMADFPREFFDDELGNDATAEEWKTWVSEDAELVETVVITVNTGGLINSRFKNIRARGTR